MNPVDPRDTPMSPEAVAALPAAGFLGGLLGVTRLALAGIVVVVATVVILASSLVPLKIRDTRLSLWATAGTARALLAIFGVRLIVDDPKRLRAHRGFVFFNHFSWIDPVVLMAATPVRYLAAAGVKKLPFIGWVGRAVGTVFVNRGNDASREAARDGLRDAIASSLTPVALAPEGGIKPGPPVRPFRYGAFEVAAEARQPVLLVALAYTPWARAAWQDGETLIDAAWRVSARRGPFIARVTPLERVMPSASGIEADARAAEATLNEALTRAGE
ncbi:MAG: hypothetical protein Rubg2KO_20460 [Rubricoccaceae bacterium]